VCTNYPSRERAEESWKLIGGFIEHFEGFSEHGIFHGIYRALQGGKHQYHEIKIELGMVSQSLIYRCSRAIRKSAIPEQVLEKHYCFSKTIGSVITI